LEQKRRFRMTILCQSGMADVSSAKYLAGVNVVLDSIRRLYRTYPLLSAYGLYQFARWVYVFLAGTRGAGYLGLNALDALLGLAVVYEIFGQTFRDFEGLQKLACAIFLWATSVLAVLGTVVAASMSGTISLRVGTGLQVLGGTTSVVVGGLLFFLGTFCQPRRFTWKHVAFCATTGSGVVTSVIRDGTFVTFSGVMRASEPYSFFHAMSYNLAVLIWIFWLSSAGWERTAEKFPESGTLPDLNQALMEVLNR